MNILEPKTGVALETTAQVVDYFTLTAHPKALYSSCTIAIVFCIHILGKILDQEH